jgi:hypothetical protein
MGVLDPNGVSSNGGWGNVADDGPDLHNHIDTAQGIYTPIDQVGSSPVTAIIAFATETINTSVASITVVGNCVLSAGADSCTLTLRNAALANIGSQERTSSGAFSFSVSNPGALTQSDVNALNMLISGADAGLAGTVTLTSVVVTLTQTSASSPNYAPVDLGFSLGLGL